MNLVDTEVIEVLAPPVRIAERDWWAVRVKADCYGQIYETIVYCKSEPEAQAVKPGYVWQT